MTVGRQSVLIAAPFRRDANVLGKILEQHGFDVQSCSDRNALALELGGDPPPIVMTQEGLTAEILDLLRAYLLAQDGWSELPLVVLLERQQNIATTAARLRLSLPSAKVTFLQRPVRTVELISSIHAAVAARQRQLQVRDNLALQKELQRELNHRVKNALANVTAIYHLTKRQSTSFEKFTKSFEGRLEALSRVHGALVATDEARDIADLAMVVLAPYRTPGKSRVMIEGPAATLAPARSVTFALCLHELATNASKYGALSKGVGSVSLRWTLQQTGDGWVAAIQWIERGGPPVVPPDRKGYGTAFITSAIKSSMRSVAHFDFDRGGLCCSWTVPVDRSIPAAAVA